MKGYLRNDGRKGIRNYIAVVYLVECAHHVARAISSSFPDQAQLIGFPGCFPNEYAQTMVERLCTHPNVGAVLIVSLGCESFNRQKLAEVIKLSDRPVKTVIIQESGGTARSIDTGKRWIEGVQRNQLDTSPSVELSLADLTIATVCGGSDGTSGLSGNPAVGQAFDQLVDAGARCIFEETGELIGCENFMAARATTPELGEEVISAVNKAANYYDTLGFGSFAPGNADGGLTTIEEKSLGAYAKSGSRPIVGLIKPGDIPKMSGLYLLDVVPDGEVRFGFPNIADNAEIVEMIACGAHLTLFVTGRGSVVGSALAPVIKVAANPEMYRQLQDDMDINAGTIIEGLATIEDVGTEIVRCIKAVTSGLSTKSEALGHAEFILTYKQFQATGPRCLPA